VVYGKHLTNNFPTAVKVINPAAEDFMKSLTEMQSVMQENIVAAQSRMAKYYDKKVSKTTPNFKVGDWVMVRADYIKTKCRSKELDHKLRGKFKNKRYIRMRAYKLELPLSSGKIRPVFYVGLLKPYHKNTIPGRREATPPPVDVKENQYEVEAIRDSKVVNRIVKYLVAWRGFGPNKNTWELYEHIVDGSADALKEFHLLHSWMPRDL